MHDLFRYPQTTTKQILLFSSTIHIHNQYIAICESSLASKILAFDAPTISISRTKRKIVSGPRDSIKVSAAKSGNFFLGSIFKSCETCGAKGAIECPGCKGTGKNKKNGNIFERWKCFDCQGFGMKSCPKCGKGGLTPEQRGER